jgi:hypothetical protein
MTSQELMLESVENEELWVAPSGIVKGSQK